MPDSGVVPDSGAVSGSSAGREGIIPFVSQAKPSQYWVGGGCGSLE